jgi:hypothetical protein
VVVVVGGWVGWGGGGGGGGVILLLEFSLFNTNTLTNYHSLTDTPTFHSLIYTFTLIHLSSPSHLSLSLSIFLSAFVERTQPQLSAEIRISSCNELGVAWRGGRRVYFLICIRGADPAPALSGDTHQ